MGINWVSGIEMGLRLMGWVSDQGRLLDRMPGIERIFEANRGIPSAVACSSVVDSPTFYSRFSSQTII